MNDTYTHNADCANCGILQGYHIPKGTTISDFLARQTCRNCGCRMAVAEYSPKERGNIKMVAESDDERGRVGL